MLFPLTTPNLSASDEYISKGVDYLHTGVAHTDVPFQLIWKAEILGTYDEFSGALIVDNWVYSANKSDNIFRCLYLGGGSTKWSFQLNTGTDGAPLWWDDKVYVGTGNFGSGAKASLYCFNADNGDNIWRVDGTNNDYYTSTPWMNTDNEYVYWVDGQYLRCIYADNGDTRWTADIGAGDHPYVGVYYDNITYCPGLVRAYDADNGDLLWAIDNVVWDSGITIDNENADNVVLYVGSRGALDNARVWCIDAENGDNYWSISISASAFTTAVLTVPAVFENHVYAGGSTSLVGDNAFFCLSKENGDIIWGAEVATGVFRPSVHSSPTILPSSNVAYVTTGGWLRVRNAENGDLVWENYLDANSYCGQVAVADNHLVVSSDSGHLWCFGLGGIPPTVSTTSATASGTTATLDGSLADPGSSSPYILFQWRKQGDSTWRETSKTSTSSQSDFSKVVSMLSGHTTYEFRAAAEYTSVVYGSTLTFTTSRVVPPYVPPPPEDEDEEEEEPEEEPEEVPEVTPEVPEEVAPAVFTPKATPKVWYAQYMEAQERPPDAPFPTFEPFFLPPLMAATEAADGQFFISSALAMGILIGVMVVTRPKSRLDETPQNWKKGSGSGSWTFISKAAVVLVGFSAVTALWMVLRFGFSTMSITYGVMAVVSMVILLREQVPGRTGAFIGIGKGRLREAIFGGCFGAFFLLLMGWVGHWIGVGGGMSITGAYALPLLLFGVIIPYHEEVTFRGVIAPTLTEKYGMALAIGASGLAFGAVHLLFGGSMWLFSVTTIFGIIMGFFALRQQSIVLPLAAHCTYNSFSFALFILLGAG